MTIKCKVKKDGTVFHNGNFYSSRVLCRHVGEEVVIHDNGFETAIEIIFELSNGRYFSAEKLTPFPFSAREKGRAERYLRTLNT